MNKTLSGCSDRRVLWLCFLAAMIEGFDIQAAGVAAPKLAPALGLTPAQMGMFFSAATFGLIFGAIAGGRIADRFGRRMGLVLALLAFGVFSIATAFVSGFTELAVLRFLTGVGLGGALPNLVAIAAEAAPPERRGSAVAIMYAGIPLGGAVASLVPLFGLHGGWQEVFLIGGILPLAIIPVLLLQLPDLRVPAVMEADTARTAGAVRKIVGSGMLVSTLSLWIGFFFSLLVLYLLLNWLPALLVSRGFSPAEAGIVQIVFNVAGAGGSLLTGRALDSPHRRMTVATTFGALILALAVLAMLPANLPLTVLAAAFTGAAVIAVQAILYGLAPQCYAAAVRGTGVGLAVAAGRLGSVAGPLLAGGLVASGRSPGEVLMGIVPIAILGGLSAYVLVGRRPSASPLQPARAA